MTYERPSPGEEVVISGISGRYPESKNVLELQHNLFHKVDVITSNATRRNIDDPDIPKYGGKVHGLTKFDACFFGIKFKQAHAMDPICRLLLEHSYEAIVDAGIHPGHLRGSKTGVIIGTSFSESEKKWFYDDTEKNGLGVIGCNRSMAPNWISYTLGLNGPSYSIDAACSSSAFALDQAYKMIRSGQCDNVLVGTAHLCLHPRLSAQFVHLGVLSPDCRCKSFDESANGYVRSEAISVLLLQKARNAKRIYATVVYTKANCDGYKEQGITFPSSDAQTSLLEEFYKDCQISPSILSWMEAHGTGTAVGDPVELSAISKVLCRGRDTPLRIGSLKSNIGHTEAASGLSSVTKVIISMETGLIPPNLHFQKPAKGIECFDEGKAVVITESTPWDGGYVGINSFGFGGTNAHILLKSNPKKKVNLGKSTDDLPRIVAVSGRTEEAVDTFLEQVENLPVVDVEYIRLIHDIHAENVPQHSFRGYTIVPKSTDHNAREIQRYSDSKRPVWFVFSGMESMSIGMGEPLMKFPVFAKTIETCDAVLKPHGINLLDIITSKDKTMFNNILNSFVGISAVQIGLVDLLTSVGIVPDNMIGLSVGELGCAYADRCLTAEQMILSAYYRGLACIETEIIRGSMAVVGLGYEDVKDQCPDDVEVACHIGPAVCTISGPTNSIKQFVAVLQGKNVSAEELPSGNVAFHSRYIRNAGPMLKAYLKNVMPDLKPRSPKWISTSVPRSRWSSLEAQYSSAEYHTNNFLSPVLFAEMVRAIPENAITIEIGLDHLLETIIRRTRGEGVTHVALLERGHTYNSEFFLKALGKLYNVGLQPHFANIYPPVEFPVSRGTPMISPYIMWDHSHDWYVPIYSQQEEATTGRRTVDIALNNETYQFMSGHIIDGDNIIPTTGLLVLVWETFSTMKGKVYNELPIVFENIIFECATTIPENGSVKLTVKIHKGNGQFEIDEGNTILVSGIVRVGSDTDQEKTNPQLLMKNDTDERLTTIDIYNELKLRGYEYTGLFRSLKSASIDGTKGHIIWMNNWSTFMEGMLQLKLFGTNSRRLVLPTGILKMVIDTKSHNYMVQNTWATNHQFPVFVHRNYDVIVAGGVEIRGLKVNAVPRRKAMITPVLEEYKFVPNRDKAEVTSKEMIILSTHLAIENVTALTPKFIELVMDDNVNIEQLYSPTFLQVLENVPKVQPLMALATESEQFTSGFIPNITVMNLNSMPQDNSFYMAAAFDILSKRRRQSFEQLLRAIQERGFLILQETSLDNDTFLYLDECGLSIVLEKTNKNTTFLLLRKREKPANRTQIVYVNNNEFSWFYEIQRTLEAMEEKQTKETVKLVLVAEGDLDNGVLGFVRCLKLEPNGEIVKTVIIQDDEAPKFSLDHPLYAKQLAIDIDINVLRPGGVWGTYRHLPLPSIQQQPSFHGIVTQMARGDLNSLQWVQGPIQPDIDKSCITRIAYSSVNSKDIMTTTNKLAAKTSFNSTEDQAFVNGFEYSGISPQGLPVMGLTTNRALSNICIPDRNLEFPVPDGWSLEDAATVPFAYITAYYALFYHGKLQKGEKVLIHNGTNAVSQAAIHLALHEECEVFTTVRSPEQCKFIKKTFPSIDDNHIGKSRETSFERLVMKQTKGKGVNLVLNSLTENKLSASLRCLGYRGRLLELSKFDLSSNWWLDVQEKLYDDIRKVLHSKAVKPLVRAIFPKDEIQAAFKYMATKEHFGKVLIKVQDDDSAMGVPILAYPYFHAVPNKSYIIIGGLGGLGLELSDWLVARGARNLVLISRNGITNGYQRMRIEIWKSYGVKVLIITGVDASTTEGCEFILRTAETEAPVDGIFNLAAVLIDSLYVNQTVKSFEAVLKPKVGITKKMDHVSRKICRQLRHFVVFSSFSCGRGSAGQTNYGMGNAVMERICERRKNEGLPGLAIEWGTVDDVGIVANIIENNKQLTLEGIMRQKISSCLEELDHFLMLGRPIVASTVVAEKETNHTYKTTILQALLNIMSLEDLKSVNHVSSLPQLGMDSMMAVEIKQILEHDFGVFMSPSEIRSLNISKIIEMSMKYSKKFTSKTNH